MHQPSQHLLHRKLHLQVLGSKQAPFQERLLHCDLSSLNPKPSSILRHHGYLREGHRVRPQLPLAVEEYHQGEEGDQGAAVEEPQHPVGALAVAGVVLCPAALEEVEEVRRCWALAVGEELPVLALVGEVESRTKEVVGEELVRRQEGLAELDEMPMVVVEGVLAEHCSSEGAVAEVKFLVSLVVMEGAQTGCSAQEAAEGQVRDLEVEVVPQKARGCL